MPTYLLVWGTSTHEVRTGSGNPRSAAIEAFGEYNPKRQTILPIKASVLHSDARRTQFIAELLRIHAERMDACGETIAAKNARTSRATIVRDWSAAWAKLKPSKDRP